MRESSRPQCVRLTGDCILCVAPERTFQPVRQSKPPQFDLEFVARLDMELAKPAAQQNPEGRR
jgi:hypothetical protein